MCNEWCDDASSTSKKELLSSLDWKPIFAKLLYPQPLRPFCHIALRESDLGRLLIVVISGTFISASSSMGAGVFTGLFLLGISMGNFLWCQACLTAPEIVFRQYNGMLMVSGGSLVCFYFEFSTGDFLWCQACLTAREIVFRQYNGMVTIYILYSCRGRRIHNYLITVEIWFILLWI